MKEEKEILVVDEEKEVKVVYSEIRELIEASKRNVYQTVNTEMLRVLVCKRIANYFRIYSMEKI